MKRRIFIIFSAVFFITNAQAQFLWNKKIDEAQKVLLRKDSFGNNLIQVSNSTDINLIATNYVVNKVDVWQKKIDTSKQFNTNDKIKYLRILLNYVNQFNTNTKNRKKVKNYTVNLSRELFEDFDKTIDVHLGKTSLVDIIKNKSLLSTQIILGEEYAKNATGYEEARGEYYYKDCISNPDKILTILNQYPTVKNADSLIVLAAYNNQDKLYDFAQCKKCAVEDLIKRNENSLVKTLYRMAQMETGRSLTPFLDAISRNEITIDSINKIQANENAYYKLLVNTRIGYSKRIENGENIIAIKNFSEKIKEVALNFVKEINELHNKPDNIRFASINSLNAKELYYLAVYGIDELFTSSFNRGVFAQIVSKLNGINSNTLLQQVNYDYFRKFIKISAGYNKLSQFLKLMPDSNAVVLMNNFVSNLVQNSDELDIEDAVDVADAYVGIGTNPELKKVSDKMQQNVKLFEEEFQQGDDKKGTTIYRLLSQIFNAYKDTSINLSSQIGIPSITKVEYKDLINEKGVTNVKVYFYGDEDKDGQNSFINFMGLFSDKTMWSVDYKNKPYFITVKSLKGKPIQIFANYPLYDASKKTDPDDTAKLRMSNFIVKQDIQPNLIMHRGHSYHVPITLKFMEEYDTSAKLIVLGSCGGYQNLQRVLQICPDAHIVSSKQTGTMRVNDPMLRILFGNLTKNQNIVWPEAWPRIKAAVGGGDAGEMFTEYISPEKNLGMIFIKAYKKQMGL